MEKVIKDFVNLTNVSIFSDVDVTNIICNLDLFLKNQNVKNYYEMLKGKYSSNNRQVNVINFRTMLMSLPPSAMVKETICDYILDHVLISLFDRFYYYQKRNVFSICVEPIVGNIPVDEQIFLESAFLDIFSLLDKMLFNIYSILYNNMIFKSDVQNASILAQRPYFIIFPSFLPNVKDLKEDIKKFQNIKNESTNINFKFGNVKDVIEKILQTYLYNQDCKLMNDIRNNSIHNDIRVDNCLTFINIGQNPHPINIYTYWISKIIVELIQLFDIMLSLR